MIECVLIAADALFEKPRVSSVLVVISPLRSFMEDQIRHLDNMPELSRIIANTKRNTVNI